MYNARNFLNQAYPEEILVAHDEMDLPPGVAKFKQGGGHGGHNGLKDIISKLGNNNNFHRLRVGIGHPGDRNKVTGFVLGHNAGAWYLDLLASRHNQALKEEPKFFGYTARLALAGNDVRLLVPTTYMNLSGKAVAAMATFYRITPFTCSTLFYIEID
ncbi:hypothetical protein CRX72_20180 [Pantoea sp. BRM17]|nr:hypothetical protein CRX72_20180 [Pantoea sp. BRM17]